MKLIPLVCSKEALVETIRVPDPFVPDHGCHGLLIFPSRLYESHPINSTLVSLMHKLE